MELARLRRAQDFVVAQHLDPRKRERSEANRRRLNWFMVAINVIAAVLNGWAAELNAARGHWFWVGVEVIIVIMQVTMGVGVYRFNRRHIPRFHGWESRSRFCATCWDDWRGTPDTDRPPTSAFFDALEGLDDLPKDAIAWPVQGAWVRRGACALHLPQAVRRRKRRTWRWDTGEDVNRKTMEHELVIRALGG